VSLQKEKKKKKNFTVVGKGTSFPIDDHSSVADTGGGGACWLKAPFVGGRKN